MMIKKLIPCILFALGVLVPVSPGGQRQSAAQAQDIETARFDPPVFQTGTTEDFQFNRGDVFLSITAYRSGFPNIAIPGELEGRRVTRISNSAFQGNGLTGLILPNSLDGIGESACAENRLTSIVIPSSVGVIGARAFAGNQLTNLAIYSGTKRIGKEAFRDNQLRSVHLPLTIEEVEAGAFTGNPVQALIIGGDVNLGDDSFDNEFAAYYTAQNRAAGTYMYLNGQWQSGETVQAVPVRQPEEKPPASDKKTTRFTGDQSFAFFFPAGSFTRGFATIDEAEAFVRAATIKFGRSLGDNRYVKGLGAKLQGPAVPANAPVTLVCDIHAYNNRSWINLSQIDEPLDTVLRLKADNIIRIFLIFYNGRAVSLPEYYLGPRYSGYTNGNAQIESFTVFNNTYEARYPVGWGIRQAFQYLRGERN